MGLPRWGLVVVRGRSMQPTLRERDRLLVRYGVVPTLGQLAVVRLPDRPLAIKRVTGRETQGWWIERDNPAEGVDSWLVGAIADDDVVAVVRWRVWPPSRMGRLARQRID
ncbi:MAG: peptidase S24 [Nocardioidaceae bacterium]|nr:peptidase S24 [Nocardioidaceae bacterium]